MGCYISFFSQGNSYSQLDIDDVLKISESEREQKLKVNTQRLCQIEPVQYKRTCISYVRV